jgi:hypothetical protein
MMAVMGQPAQHTDDTARMLDAAGIAVTPEGKARARARLDAAARKLDDEQRVALRQVGTTAA